MKFDKDNIALFGKGATQALLAAEGLAAKMAARPMQLGNVDIANMASVKALQNMPTRGNAFKMQEQPAYEQPAALTF